MEKNTIVQETEVFKYSRNKRSFKGWQPTADYLYLMI